MTLKKKLFASNMVLAIVPATLISVIVLRQVDKGFQTASAGAGTALTSCSETAKGALTEGGLTDLTHVAQNVYAMCQAQQDLLQQTVGYDLNVAHAALQQAGPVSFAQEAVSWTAVNQSTNEQVTVSLPKMMVGQTWLGQNVDAKTASPVVDKVRQLVGGTCTIFQRMNEKGDILRVCTNVQKTDGARAIGTFIPASNPDGTPNPVVAAVMKGETFQGRAFVVDAWCTTAYEPIKDASNNVVGALYVGVKEESSTALRKAIMSVKVGKTGYVYVLNAAGKTRGYYVISKDGKRDGDNLWEAKDSDGRLFIQDICQKALVLRHYSIEG